MTSSVLNSRENAIYEFRTVLNYLALNNEALYEVVLTYFEEEVPNYFWTVAASSTGKYHPEFSLGEGGLVRHTKAALLVAEELSKLEMFSNVDMVNAYTALLLHDTIKMSKGRKQYTTKTHAQDASIAFYSQVLKSQNPMIYHCGSSISNAMYTHMGQWDNEKQFYNAMILGDHKDSDLCRFVHLCDYIASRKLFDLGVDELNEKFR